eukprot:jgi/Chlat1/529/Chrsp103S01113
MAAACAPTAHVVRGAAAAGPSAQLRDASEAQVALNHGVLPGSQRSSAARFVSFVGLRPAAGRAAVSARKGHAGAARHASHAVASSSASTSTQSLVEVADLEQILKERDACGVGVLARLDNTPTHRVVSEALIALGCMEHRGGCSADDDSGDGAGVMTAIPWQLFQEWAASQGQPALDDKHTGVAMVFLPRETSAAAEAIKIMEQVLEKEGLELLGWRDVPSNPDVVGPVAHETIPLIKQCFVKGTVEGKSLERELFVARKLVEAAVVEQPWADDMYICTFSSRVIVYKGMLRSVVLGEFYDDLRNESYTSAFAIYHRRFSTNTNPKWKLAQPMRFLGHNGEINTLQGNLNWMRSREADMSSPIWEGREAELKPITNLAASDSANLDMVAELLVKSGRSAEESLMILVPEAYRKHPTLDVKFPEVVDFYDFYAGQMEAWDGPALLVFCDGETLGAALDRNGLRPARYWRTSDGMFYVASEVGVVNMDESKVEYKGRLGPGMMVSVHMPSGEVLENTAIKKSVAAGAPYKQWLQDNSHMLTAVPFAAEPRMGAADLLTVQTAYGYSIEDVQLIIESMAAQAKEPTFCMGDDIPLAVLSQKAHLLYDYFKQRFAQVTNPAIDPLREGLVMSLEMTLGPKGNLLDLCPEDAKQWRIQSPVLSEGELESIYANDALAAVSFDLHYDIQDGSLGALKAAVQALCEKVAAAVKVGAHVLVLSDRTEKEDENAPAIPALLATGAVHHFLIQQGLRTKASLVVDTAQCFSTHHFACLVGYGASAICPYGALETCRQWAANPKTRGLMERGKLPEVTVQQAQKNFQKAINSGLLKILSKMGISLLSSYHGAQIFEIYGLGADVVDTAFRGSVSRIGGMTFQDLARESYTFWQSAFPGAKKLENFGFITARPTGEYHGNNPDMSKLLHKAVRQGSTEAYEAYQAHVAGRPVNVLRDLLELTSDRSPISLDEVESATSIVERFCTGGMSLGAISRETHEAIAIAMNRIGGKSNSGEGGEDPVRWKHLDDVSEDGLSPTLPHLKGLKQGDTATSAIKQVASGRFGVTPTFLVNASQIEIKIAQGAKPGEGGQLPGKKVSPYIAMLRRSKAGVPLISPPPHHDIYSIEDLAQLIYDLHQVNPAAKVSVKLVAEAGIGTVASGVAKANADVIQISGHDGGTGASPISSIKHAGGPWEMGLVETHLSLLQNGLRDRVVLRVDGGFKSGFDVMLAAAMGADEFGFGSVAMIATGCIMARICHTNNCPVGVASQREELRARFPGVPGDLVNYFLFVAEEVRASLAELGYKRLDDIIGRSDLLKSRGVELAKTSAIDLSFLLSQTPVECGTSSERRAQPVHSNGPVLDEELLDDPEVKLAIEEERHVTKSVEITNVDRCVGARIAGVIAKKYGDTGFAGQLDITFTGSAGQSFGAFITPGMSLKLVGESNDYVGKGMAGGEIIIVPKPEATFEPSKSVILGNTCMYGATGGVLLAAGCAGERFAVRNSLGEAVVEGTGDHCCEYMTGGCVVVLGKVGRNVAAGMTGGLGYFLDEDSTFEAKVNKEIVTMQRVKTAAGETQLQRLIQAHVDKTGSAKGQAILADWANYLPKFWQLVPPSEAHTPEASSELGSLPAEAQPAAA